MLNLTLYCVNAVFILDNEGSRLFANYYSPPHAVENGPAQNAPVPNKQPYPTMSAQKAFESGLFDKTKKQSSDVILYDGRIVVYKTLIDSTIYVVGGIEESELMLYQVVVAMKDAFEVLFR
jgi:hypothetical protein